MMRHRRTLQATTRQAGAFLAVTIVQQQDSGETLVSLLPLPYGLALLTWLAAAWLAVWPVLVRLGLEAGWLVEDGLARLHLWAGSLTAAAGLVEGLAVRFYLAATMLEVLARSLWWAIGR
jgi:hypothetical protein